MQDGRSRVVVRTEKVPDPGHLHRLLPETGSLAWLRHGDGFVAWGEAGRVALTGPDRFTEGDRWWRRWVGGVDVEDDVGVPGSGPLAVASFAFADEPGSSTLIVPRVVVGRRNGVTWRTVVGEAEPDPLLTDRRAPHGVQVADDTAEMERWRDAVAAAVATIRDGELEKVVLAAPTEAVADADLDARELLVRLLDRYPACWGFLIDGLVGATPELLVERIAQDVRSRVLAGTSPLGAGSDVTAVGAALLRSSKDLAEHRLAARPVADALRKHVELVAVPDGPSLLELPNVVHLATEMRGRLRGEMSALALAGALHPTPAVAGTPREPSLRLIEELEPFDRGRYAGPVGWVDARGDGEFCVALRCAAVSGRAARLYAGCGIVADSEPHAEVAEWRAKLRPVLGA